MPPKERPLLFDEDIRLLVFDYLDLTYPKVRTFEEKIMGRSRSDIIVLLPDSIMGLEIKSDADSYARLASQVKDYDKYFDKNYIAVGSSHIKSVSDHVPPYWGILLVDQTEEEPIVREVRTAENNPKCKLKTQLSFMWRAELFALQKQNGLPIYANKKRSFRENLLIERVEAGKLRAQICDILFERDYSVFEKE